VLQHAVVKLYGAEPVAFPASFAVAPIAIGPVTVTALSLVILGTSLALMVLLDTVLRRTWLGKAIRATSENPTVAGLLGVNVPGVIVAVFVLASALAGAAGVLLAANFTAVTPFFGVKVGLKALAVMLLGGLGNVPGAMVGGLLLGVGLNLLGAYVEFVGADLRLPAALLIILVVLLVKPSGLFGKPVVRRV
jgi:branched-chain amino acid transport system permease protein